MFLKTCSDVVGSLSDILAAAFSARDNVDQVVKLTREVLWYDVPAFGGSAYDSA